MAGGCCVKTYAKGQGVVSLYPQEKLSINLLGEASTALDWESKLTMK